ncbi:MAG: DUF432 domain-containing protein [ANME-2 cluster archaeon]|nr:DUF432 domain-containing protein [ANME-2 cluster archaeon]
MYGSYDIPLKIEHESFSLSIEKAGNLHIYKREVFYGTEEKVLLFDDAKIILNPIEPVNKPKNITAFLLIEFEKPFVVGPGTSNPVYIKFPIEIGVFISNNKQFEILDVLTLVKQKFTLYGDPARGMICKYWKSEVYPGIPEADPMMEGVMEVKIENTTSRWIEISKAVFNAYDMRLYYNNDMVSMKSKMKIMGEQIAKTVFFNSPIRNEMEKSIERYTAGKVSVMGPKFMMEGGL